MERTQPWPRGIGDIAGKKRAPALPNLAIADICITAVRCLAVVIIALITFDCASINPLSPTSPMFSSARALGFALALALVRADVVTEGTPIGSLYAYGSGISGLPVIYSDGKTSSPVAVVIDCTDMVNRLCPSWLGKTFVRKRGKQRDL